MGPSIPVLPHFEQNFLPFLMRPGQLRAPVQQDLEYLVVVLVGGEDERGDVGGEGGRVGGERLPALIKSLIKPVKIRAIKELVKSVYSSK